MPLRGSQQCNLGSIRRVSLPSLMRNFHPLRPLTVRWFPAFVRYSRLSSDRSSRGNQSPGLVVGVPGL